MSINSAYNIANTGLKSTGKWAELVSNNIANADSDSYGRRTLSKTTTAMGTAVANGVNRAVDQSLTRMYHSELARMTRQDAIADGVSAYATSLGDVDDPSSPAALLTNFQSNLDLLYNDPSDASVQQAAVQSAGAIATDHCKGCMVCVAQCPSHAIEAIPEKQAKADEDATQLEIGEIT